MRAVRLLCSAHTVSCLPTCLAACLATWLAGWGDFRSDRLRTKPENKTLSFTQTGSGQPPGTNRPCLSPPRRYEMCTYTRPFEASNQAALMLKILRCAENQNIISQKKENETEMKQSTERNGRRCVANGYKQSLQREETETEQSTQSNARRMDICSSEARFDLIACAFS